MKDLLDHDDEKLKVEQAYKHKEIILPSSDLSIDKNIGILRYTLKIIEERLHTLEVSKDA